MLAAVLSCAVTVLTFLVWVLAAVLSCAVIVLTLLVWRCNCPHAALVFGASLEVAVAGIVTDLMLSAQALGAVAFLVARCAESIVFFK